MDFTYINHPPKKWTFEMKPVRLWVEKWCNGKVLNLFAGKTKLEVNEVRIDASSEWNPYYCMDAYEFVSKEELTNYNTIVLDPPYNLRKSREKYEGRYIGSFTKIKNEIAKKVKSGTRIITLGYDSTGMSKCRGFKKIAICLVCHNGDHNDTICLVEEKI